MRDTTKAFVVALCCALAVVAASAQTSPQTSLPQAVPQSSPSTAAPPIKAATEIREHRHLTFPSPSDDFDITTIRRPSEKIERGVTLVRSASGDEYIFSYEHNFENQKVYREVRRRDGKEFLRMTRWLPFTATTRSATFEEGRKHPETLSMDVRFEATTVGTAAVSGMVSGWNDRQMARDWRKSIRSMLTSQFVEELEILFASGLFRSGEMAGYDKLLMEFVMYRPECEPGFTPQSEPLLPDCAFDSHFGYDCSDAQKARAAKIQKNGPLTPSSIAAY